MPQQSGSKWGSDESRRETRDKLTWRLQRHLRRLIHNTVLSGLDTVITGPVDGVSERDMDHLLVESVHEVADGAVDGFVIGGLITDDVVDNIFARAAHSVGQAPEVRSVNAKEVDAIFNASLDEVITRLTEAFTDGGYLDRACGHVLEDFQSRMREAAK